MATLKRKTVQISAAQDAFIKRKVRDIRKLVDHGTEDNVTDSSVLRGLIDFWMAFEGGRLKDNFPHKEVIPK